jgi:carbamoyl-phosphate synthase large subunit
MYSVLVTAAGGIIGQGIIKSLRLINNYNYNYNYNNNYRIIAADSSPLSAGLYRSDIGLVIPRASEASYIDSLIKHLKKYDASALFVGSDEELITIAVAKGRIEEETATKVLVAEPRVVKIARDKWETYKFLRSNNLDCAESCLPEDKEEFINKFGFPVVVKPREGYGSMYFFVTNSHAEVEYALGKIQEHGWKPMLQEHLIGEEFTTGVTIDKTGSYVMSSIAIRKYLKGGQTYKAFIDDDYQPARRSAENTAKRLGLKGAVNIQTKNTKVFEINPRFSATCPLRAYAGVNEPDIVFRNTVLDEKIPKVSAHRRLVCIRYWNEVYFERSTYEQLINNGSIQDGKKSSSIPGYF